MTQNTFDFTEEDKVRAATRTERILDILRTGPKTSVELMCVTHRFSACVRSLREQGYDIAVERLDAGVSLHTLTGYTPRVRVTDEMKAAYYASGHWSAKRLERKEFDGFACCHCHASDELQVHHWNYDLFAEPLEDLMTLCRRCHEAIHNYDAVRIHFPAFVSPEIASRLTTQEVR